MVQQILAGPELLQIFGGKNCFIQNCAEIRCFDGIIFFRLLKVPVQPFELGGETRLILSAVKYLKPGKCLKRFLMIQSHERSIKPISAA
jgi:hypothetical protein